MTKSEFISRDHSLRIGVVAVQNDSWEKILERCLLCEELGFDSIWYPDHFLHWNKTMMPFFELWTTLSALASQTSRIRLGTLVTAMHWRNPAWLAKQALTVDHISKGRLELGLGAGGSSKIEYSMTGVEEWEPSEKVKRFREYVEIVDQLLRNPVTTYHGKYYHLEETVMQPDSIQKPRPPLTLGAHRPRMLQIAAQYADTWNTLGDPISNEESMESVKQRIKLLETYSKKINRNNQKIRLSFLVYERDVVHNFAKSKLYESTEIFKETVEKCLDLGFTEILVPYPLIEEEIPIFKKIAQEVIPEIRNSYS